MRFTVLSLFPEFFDSPLSSGLMAKGIEAGLVSFALVNPRDYTDDAHRTVDDRPYGGGPGMVMMAEPLARALRAVPERGRVLVLSPSGRPFDQAMARELAREDALTLVCGRYEGIDARLAELFDVEEVSVGDFVLNGGEAGALCVIEAVGRLLPGFMGHADSGDEESFSAGLLEYPHYTRPEVFEGLAVPPVLTSGDHARIAAWRREQALRRTLERRPELLADARLDEGDVTYVRDLVAGRAGNGAGDAAQAGGLADGPESAAENAPGATKNFPRAPFGGRKRLGRNLYLALLHYPVVNKRGKVGAVSLTNLDVHDIARVSRSNGLGGYYLATPIEDQRRLIAELTEHWIGGAGRTANPDRAEALSLVRVCADLDEILDDVARRTGARPALIATSARGAGDMTASRVRELLERVPVLLVMGTASGLAPEVLARAQGVVRPIRWMDAYNHLSVRSAAAILVDRILADVH